MNNEAAWFATTDTKLASCLATVGVPLRQQDPITRVVKNGRESWHFWFEASGAGGATTDQIAEAVLNGQETTEAMADKLPDLPGARAALFNREALLDLGNRHCRRLVMVTLPSGTVILADEHLSAETKRQVAQMAL